MNLLRNSLEVIFLISYLSLAVPTNVTETTVPTNTSSIAPSETSIEPDEHPWMRETVQDVGYYLRSHKFNEFDRRYHRNGTNAPRDYFSHFPRPPLRSLHWEVHASCEPSFLSCIEYLRKKVAKTGLQRSQDTSQIINDQKWEKKTHFPQIQAVDAECRSLQREDDILANPFQGPIERFQWRTSAAYYMCWYTMLQEPILRKFYERCDNYANCFDPTIGARSEDYRVNDNVNFSCALFSFCPDPCCPKKYYTFPEQCDNSAENPCLSENIVGHRTCKLLQSENVDFRSLILNQWNVSCECPQPGEGYHWDSMYSICVDVDECVNATTHACDVETEACLNLPGSFRCVCKWGFTLVDGQCTKDPAVELIKLAQVSANQTKQERKATSLIKYLYNLIIGQ